MATDINSSNIIYLNGELYRVISTWKGTENLSYHGSMSFETFIQAQNLTTGECTTFGSGKYRWQNAKDYIADLESRLKGSKELVEKLSTALGYWD